MRTTYSMVKQCSHDSSDFGGSLGELANGAENHHINLMSRRDQS
jgi:hypothetical protein